MSKKDLVILIKTFVFVLCKKGSDITGTRLCHGSVIHVSAHVNIM